MSFDKYILQSQMILVMDDIDVASRILFLTNDPSTLKDSLVYRMYQNIKDTGTTVPEFENCEIKIDHVMLSYTIEQCKEYIGQLLGVKNTLTLYSWYVDLEYQHLGQKIFDPFVHSGNKKHSDNSVIYQIYPASI